MKRLLIATISFASICLASSAFSAIRVGGIAFDNPLNGPGNPATGGGSTSCLAVVSKPIKATVYNSGNIDLNVNICSARDSRCTKSVIKKKTTKSYTGTLSGQCRTTDPLYLRYHDSKTTQVRMLSNGKRYELYWTGSVWRVKLRS